MRISDWSSDVCSSDLEEAHPGRRGDIGGERGAPAAAIEFIITVPQRQPAVEVGLHRGTNVKRVGHAPALRARGAPVDGRSGREPALEVEPARPLKNQLVEFGQIGNAHAWTPITKGHLVWTFI